MRLMILLGAMAGVFLTSEACIPQVPAPPDVERTLAINMEARPGTLQFAEADDGFAYLAYELFVTNWTGRDLTLQQLDVEDAHTAQSLVQYDAKALENPVRQRSARYTGGPPSLENRRLPVGVTTMISIGIRVPIGQSRPAALQHRLKFESQPNLAMIDDAGHLSNELTSISEAVAIDADSPPLIGAPLRGGPWRCSNGLSLGNGHSAFYASRIARMRIPQRFGCDFFKVDRDGAILPSPFPNKISAGMFYGYGAEVLAVADGRIVATHDAVPEGVPQVDGSIQMPVPLTEATVAGNWIALDIGHGRYAFYAHLQPGSLRVKPGDRVRAGQTIGLLGMAGNATGPHLHFHIGNGPLLNGSDGMPYRFQQYQFGGRGKPGDSPTEMVRGRVPLANSLMTFPD